VARPTGPLFQDWLLLMQMLEVIERQMAAGERRNYIEAARIVAPIWNAARLKGRITTQTSMEAGLSGDIVRVDSGKWSDATKARHRARREKKLAAIRKPAQPWSPAAVLARFKKLRNKHSPEGRRLWAMLTNPDELERRLKLIGSRPRPRNRTKTPQRLVP
jgi:hypothetical protein